LSQLISVREAQERILQAFTAGTTVEVPLNQALRRVLAQPIRASQDLPPFANSSMDGFAVRSEDVRTASADHPVVLHVIQDIPAGSVPKLTNGAQEASRIMTGAAVPAGTDSVIPVEVTMPGEDGKQVKIYKPASAGQYIRPRGEDIQRTEPPGRRLDRIIGYFNR
jgi:molybdopterin molybdotransferase